MPNKPHKWGFKIFSTNDTNGHVYDFDIEGAPDLTKLSDFKRLCYCRADIVLKLSKNLTLDHGYKLYFDDYFVYVKLLVELKSRNI